MPQLTAAELQSKFDVLQQDYQKKLDDIFKDLYDRLDQIKPEPVAQTEEPAPKAEPPKPEPVYTPRPESPKPAYAPKAEPPKPEPVYTPRPESPKPGPTYTHQEVPKWKKPPRWRDTWTYQGLKGLASRVWRGTNPEDAAWKYAREGLLSHLTLQEYLNLKEVTNSFVDDYFVIEEATNIEIVDEFKTKIKDLVFSFFKKASALGMEMIPAVIRQGRLPFSDTEEELVKKTDLPPNTTPEIAKALKKVDVVKAPGFTDENIKTQSDILENIVKSKEYEKWKPYEPWTWFMWAKPSKLAETDAAEKQKTIEQWSANAGKKFTTNFHGLTNLFVAMQNIYSLFDYLDDEQSIDNQTKAKLAELLGYTKKQFKNNPWKHFLQQGQDKFSNEKEAIKYIKQQSKRHVGNEPVSEPIPKPAETAPVAPIAPVKPVSPSVAPQPKFIPKTRAWRNTY